MKISVVTLSYNQAPFLERCLDSVLSQKGVEVEFIVIDAGSTDGSQQILERYRDRLSLLIIEQDDGPPDGLNKGFSRATGDIFYYLNSDDVVLPGAFASAVSHFEENPDIDVIYGDGYQTDPDDKIIKKSYSVEKFTPYRYLVGATVLFQQAAFFRKRAFEAAGGFNKKNRTCWDGELWLDMVKKGVKMKHVPEFWGTFRVYDGTITGGGDARWLKQYLKERARMFQATYGRDQGVGDRLANLVFRVHNKLVVLRR